jgi:hypothetical protein
MRKRIELLIVLLCLAQTTLQDVNTNDVNNGPIDADNSKLHLIFPGWLFNFNHI